MGLDGGTVISRSDVLRGSSWRLNQSNAGSRSTRGGSVSTSEVYREPALDRQTAWCAAYVLYISGRATELFVTARAIRAATGAPRRRPLRC